MSLELRAVAAIVLAAVLIVVSEWREGRKARGRMR
jgi:hypothetical protein